MLNNMKGWLQILAYFIVTFDKGVYFTYFNHCKTEMHLSFECTKKQQWKDAYLTLTMTFYVQIKYYGISQKQLNEKKCIQGMKNLYTVKISNVYMILLIVSSVNEILEKFIYALTSNRDSIKHIWTKMKLCMTNFYVDFPHITSSMSILWL